MARFVFAVAFGALVSLAARRAAAASLSPPPLFLVLVVLRLFCFVLCPVFLFGLFGFFRGGPFLRLPFSSFSFF